RIRVQLLSCPFALSVAAAGCGVEGARLLLRLRRCAPTLGTNGKDANQRMQSGSSPAIGRMKPCSPRHSREGGSPATFVLVPDTWKSGTLDWTDMRLSGATRL